MSQSIFNTWRSIFALFRADVLHRLTVHVQATPTPVSCRIFAVLARLDQQRFLSYVALLVGGEELLPNHCKLTISLFVRATLRALSRPQTHCILSLQARFKPAQTSRCNKNKCQIPPANGEIGLPVANTFHLAGTCCSCFSLVCSSSL